MDPPLSSTTYSDRLKAAGSQATITASFSIINQCLALICFPSVKVIHTSDKRHGQVYIPDVNWLLMVLGLSITLGFHDITRIANAAEWLTDYSPGLGVSRVPGIGLIYTDIVMGIPAFFSHFITNLPAFHQVLIFESFKPQPVPCVPPSQRYCLDRVGGKDYRIYRCIVRYGYCDQVRDTDDFEEQIIGSIGEFVSLDESDCESLASPEGRKMVIVATPLLEGHASIPTDDTNLVSCSTNAANIETLAIPMGDLIRRNATVRRKKVRFLIPESSPRLRVSVRNELQELINARESGTAYFPVLTSGEHDHELPIRNCCQILSTKQPDSDPPAKKLARTACSLL